MSISFISFLVGLVVVLVAGFWRAHILRMRWINTGWPFLTLAYIAWLGGNLLIRSLGR